MRSSQNYFLFRLFYADCLDSYCCAEKGDKSNYCKPDHSVISGYGRIGLSIHGSLGNYRSVCNDRSIGDHGIGVNGGVQYVAFVKLEVGGFNSGILIVNVENDTNVTGRGKFISGSGVLVKQLTVELDREIIAFNNDHKIDISVGACRLHSLEIKRSVSRTVAKELAVYHYSTGGLSAALGTRHVAALSSAVKAVEIVIYRSGIVEVHTGVYSADFDLTGKGVAFAFAKGKTLDSAAPPESAFFGFCVSERYSFAVRGKFNSRSFGIRYRA